MLERDQDKVEKELKAYLQDIGDCVVVVADDEIVKVHVHTNHPGLAFEKALTYGSLTSMKIDNMREEHQEKLIRDAETVAKQQAEEDQREDEPKEHKADGFVVVSAGDGLSDIFKDLGADEVIEGGQTMNPSTEDILQAVEKVPADTVYILPNNGNIILAAGKKSYRGQKGCCDPFHQYPTGNCCNDQFYAGTAGRGKYTADDRGDGQRKVRPGHICGS